MSGKKCYLLILVLIISLFFPTMVLSKEVNVVRSAELINGLIIKPGEIFSFKKTIGEVSKENGFTFGYYLNDKKEAYFDSGLGICKTATALYQKVRESGFEIVERHIIFFPITYAKAKDSAYVAKEKDFRFKNNQNCSIKIESFVDDNSSVFIKIQLEPEKK